ncbi:MAG TPA: hypothetical protein VF089_13890 [Candidatus Binatia bacterium]
MGESPVLLDDVIITSQLSLRPTRSPDYRAEIQNIKILVATMSENPQAFWRRLAEAALELCRAGTAGVSLLDIEDGAEVFRAEAVAGVLGDRLAGTIPRPSPFDTAIDRDATQLMYLPGRLFPKLRFDPPILEMLIIPFRVATMPAGAVWLAAHDDTCRFDREDERIGKTLASFAAAGWHLRRTRRNAEPAIEHHPSSKSHGSRAGAEGKIEPRHMREELQQLSQSLEARASEKTAELIAGEGRIAMPQEDESQQSWLAENATAQSEIGDFDRLLTIIQGYTTIMKSDLDDPAKLKEDIEAISEAASLVQALINSQWAQRLG